MATNFSLPTVESMVEMMGMLYGDEVEIVQSTALAVPDCHIANFIDDDDVPVALGACDSAFAAYAGASLSMIPAGVAKEVIGTNALPEAIFENFREIMNICTRMLIRDPGKRLRLEKVYAPGEAAEIVSKLEAQTQRTEFQVTIPKYGPGHVAFLVT